MDLDILDMSGAALTFSVTIMKQDRIITVGNKKTLKYRTKSLSKQRSKTPTTLGSLKNPTIATAEYMIAQRSSKRKNRIIRIDLLGKAVFLKSRPTIYKHVPKKEALYNANSPLFVKTLISIF